MNNLTQGGSLGESSFSMPKLASDSIGSVLVDG